MKKIIKLACIVLAAMLGAVNLVGCGKKISDFYPENDVFTQTILSQNKTPITVLVKNAFTINAFEKAVEQKFSDIDIIQVGNHTRDMGIAEYYARLKNDDLTDIVCTWPLEVGEEFWSERLIDLSSMPLSTKYATGMLNKIEKNGRLYYLPGPSQVRGIVYNKTLFAEKGWSVPKDFEGFVALCKQIQSDEGNIKALQLPLANDEVFDTAFTGFGYAQSYSMPINAQKIANYNKGNGSFEDNYSGALDTYQRLIDEQILQKEDALVAYAKREEMLFTRKCAMVEDSVLIARAGQAANGCTDEFALMPFFNPGENGDWTRLYSVCFIGVNKHLAESKNKNKFDLVKKILNYISTPEGQTALAGDTGAMFSALNGTTPPNISEISDLLNSLKNGRYAVFPTLKNAQGALRTGLKDMLLGNKTRAEVVAAIDAQNKKPPIPASVNVLGKATQDFTLVQTGNFVTDVMRQKTGCDVALFLDNGKDGKTNSKGISGKLYKGDITSVDINRILPDLKYEDKGELWTAEITGENLIKTLEYSIPVENNRSGWFYYFSGLNMEFAPSFQPGSRIKKAKINGKNIDPEKLYTIAVADYSVNSDYLLNCKHTGLLIRDLLEDAVVSAQNITPSNDGRFCIINKLEK